MAKHRNNWRMVTEEWLLRGQRMMKGTVYALASQMYDEVIDRIPSTSGYREFTESLRVSEISGAVKKTDGGAYAVHIPAKGRRVRRVDVATTVIYVRVKKRLRKNRKDLMYLEDNGPWTADTIPFWPSYKEAVVQQRKVKKREADDVAKRQKKVASKVKRELAELGKKYAGKSKGKDGAISRDQKAIPDLAMQGLNMEFGMSGDRANPVFRPAIRAVKDGARRIPSRYPVVREAMLSPNTQRWKTWPPRQDKISRKEAANFVGFMKRLGFG